MVISRSPPCSGALLEGRQIGCRQHGAGMTATQLGDRRRVVKLPGCPVLADAGRQYQPVVRRTPAVVASETPRQIDACRPRPVRSDNQVLGFA